MSEQTTDKFGRTWPYPKNELCPECGQPDSCGDCNHQPLTDADVAEILGTDVKAMPEVITCVVCEKPLWLNLNCS